MATLISLTGTTSFDNAGNRRLAGRLGPILSSNSLSGTVRVGPKQPASCGRDVQAPIIIKLPTLRDEAFAIANNLPSTHKQGFAWDDMAVLRTDWATIDVCASALAQRKLPHRVRKRSGDNNPSADAIRVMTMKISKGLEFPVVALLGVGVLCGGYSGYAEVSDGG